MNLWEEVLARIEAKVNRHSFYTWFKPTAFIAEDTVTITVRVPNPLFTHWLTKHYSATIAEALRDLNREGLLVTFVADSIGDGTPAQLSPQEAVVFETSEPEPLKPGSAGLNPRYTFDTFIVGSSNQFA